MKKAMAIVTLVAITLCIGCSKYEDGPAVSLLTKKQRLTGRYDLESWQPEEIDSSVNIEDIHLEFFKDNTMRVEYIDEGQLRTEQGEWSFVSDKEQLRFEWDYGATDYAEIRRLTNKELWMVVDDDSESHWKKQ